MWQAAVFGGVLLAIGVVCLVLARVIHASRSQGGVKKNDAQD